jgi:hypothetical protein
MLNDIQKTIVTINSCKDASNQKNQLFEKPVLHIQVIFYIKKSNSKTSC